MYPYIAAWIAWFILAFIRRGAHRYMNYIQMRTGQRPNISVFGLLVELYVVIGFPVLVVIGAIEFFKAFMNLFN